MTLVDQDLMFIGLMGGFFGARTGFATLGFLIALRLWLRV